MAKGSFNLRKWKSNDKELLCRINQEESKSNEEQSNKTEGEIAKVLGLQWNTNRDQFQFDFDEIINFAKSLTLTKRNVLRFRAKFFDPSGFLTPSTIRVKLLFQELCLERTEWDSKLSDTHRAKYLKLISEVEQLNDIRVKLKRVMVSAKAESIGHQLHGFFDASESAIAAVVYLRTTYNDGYNPDVTLVTSKSRVASPVPERPSVPRLELQGAVLLSRLIDTIQMCLPFYTEKCYWTDSMTALAWISNYRHWKQFVRNRVNEIRKLTCVENWRHCPPPESLTLLICRQGGLIERLG